MLKICFYSAIPFITVLIFRLFKLAQGEKLEEIICGIFVGILIDFIVFIISSVVEHIRTR